MKIVATLVILAAFVAWSAAAGKDCPAAQGYACPSVYQPVCGSDGATYGNSCELSIAQMCNPRLTEVRKGECRADNNSDASGRGCPAEQEYVCAAVYQPVCGSDGNTYSNDCKLSIAQMCNPRLREVGKGECRARGRYNGARYN